MFTFPKISLSPKRPVAWAANLSRSWSRMPRTQKQHATLVIKKKKKRTRINKGGQVKVIKVIEFFVKRREEKDIQPRSPAERGIH